MAASLSWSGAAGPGVIWPRPLAPGARIGLFAPSHKFDPAELARGADVLRSWGLEVVIPRGLARRQAYLAGDDRHRLGLLAGLMEDKTVDGLLAVRGGYGCQRLLPRLAGLWAGWPSKPIYGFSDLTALHLDRFRVARVVGFHSPMLVSLGRSDPRERADGLSQADLKKALLTADRAGSWTLAERDVLRPGRAAGPLLGGNLTLVAALAASAHRPDFRGAILMLEDVDEVPYRLDRLLVTLRQSPIWAEAACLVFGRFTRCGSGTEVSRLLREAAADFPGRPVLRNAPFSHSRRNRLFPLGAMAVLEA